MDNFMIGLQNFIFRNYKRPLIKERGEYKNEVHVEGLETRYTDMCLFRDLDNLTDKVHNKVMEKLADKIADDVVDRILLHKNRQERCHLLRWLMNCRKNNTCDYNY